MKWTQHTKQSGYQVWVLAFPGIVAYVEEWTRHKGSQNTGQGNSRIDDANNSNLEFVYSVTGTFNYFPTPEAAMKWEENRIRTLVKAMVEELEKDEIPV